MKKEQVSYEKQWEILELINNLRIKSVTDGIESR